MEENNQKKSSLGTWLTRAVLVRVVMYAIVGPILGEVAAQAANIIDIATDLPHD